MAKISPHALIDPSARIGQDVEIGPFSIIGPNVTIGAGSRLHNNVTVVGNTTIGANNQFYPNCVIGTSAQDKKPSSPAVRVEIGDGNIFREAVTIHAGTDHGGGVTTIGHNNFLLVNAHVGHDCHVADNCVLTNNVMLGGHVIMANNVTLGGCVGIRQKVRIGQYCFVAAFSRITHDAPPFVKIDGPNVVRGINTVGLKRAGLSDVDIDAIEDACRRLFYYRGDKTFAAALAEFDTMNGINPHVKSLVDFMHSRDLGKGGRFLEAQRH
jgi:UDP-N-acetylglucosamine acyltransferase